MPDPTFLVIGAQKCGTTWLCEMLRQHPQIFVSREKELHFFDKKTAYAKGIEWYRAQFAGYNGEPQIGEFTPNYFWTSSDPAEMAESDLNPDIPGLVHRHYPGIKLLLVLRDPAARAVSAFYHHIKDGTISAADKILEVAGRFGIISMGYYHIHLQNWLKYFPRKQFLILIYEDEIAQNKAETLKKVFRFLEVDENFVPPNLERRFNVQPNAAYLFLQQRLPGFARCAKGLARLFPFLKQVGYAKNGAKPVEITAGERARLAEIFKDANRKLEELLGQTLPWGK